MVSHAWKLKNYQVQGGTCLQAQSIKKGNISFSVASSKYGTYTVSGFFPQCIVLISLFTYGQQEYVHIQLDP